MTLFRLIWWSDFTGAMSIDLPFENGREAFAFIGTMPGMNPQKRCGAFPIGPAEKKWDNGRPMTTRNGFIRSGS